MTNATIKGSFDNGHDFYDVIAEIAIDDTKKELDAQEIYNIVNELERADIRTHGRSYRGRCVGFQIDDSEQDNQVALGNAYFDNDGEFFPALGFEWLSWFVSNEAEIIEAFEVVNNEE